MQLKIMYERNNVPKVGTDQWYSYLQKEASSECLGYEFLKTMMWTCYYYAVGVKDWSYYYPYHSKPLISDICAVI